MKDNFEKKDVENTEETVEEKELREMAENEDTEGGLLVEITVGVTTVVSAAACPTTKCTKKCK